MKYKLLLLFWVIVSFNSEAQIPITVTTPQDLPNLIPGYSQINTINTQVLTFTYTLPPNDPDPIDGDTLTEIDDVLKYGENLSANYTLANGNYTQTSEGKVWTLSIKLLGGAKNIGLSFDSVNLSSNAEMYIYNESKTELMGPIKRDYFAPYSRITAGPCRDSIIYVYVIERNNFSSFQSSFSIKKLIAGFVDFDEDDNARMAGTGCMTSVQCFQNKMMIARAVCVVYVGGYQGTGTLINNENNNGRPLLLTAFHLIDLNDDNQISTDEIAEINGTTVLFKYWKDYCGASTYNSGIFFSGAVLRAAWKTKGGTDMALLELIDYPGIGDGVTYAGWNRNNDAPPDNTSFVIHHPKGKDMRLTKTTDVRSFLFDNNYWQAFYQDQSAVAKGSSGGALFDANNRIVGQLYRGWTSCLTSSGFSDRYGKLSSSWTGGGTASTRLQDWLSPTYNFSGVELLDPADVAISGPASVATCPSTNVQYTLNYNLTNVSYVWQWSNDFQYVNGQGTANLTLKPISFNSQASVNVTLSSFKGVNKDLVRSKTVAIATGTPTTTCSEIANGSCLKQVYLCPSELNNWQYVYIPGTWGATGSGFHLEAQGGASFNGGATSMDITSNYFSVYVPSQGAYSSSSVSVAAMNGCGVSPNQPYIIAYIEKDSWQCGGYYYSVAPNPAQSEATISLNSKNTDAAHSSFDQVSIYDQQGTLRLTKKLRKVKTSSINVSSLATGIYIVEISNGTYIERQQLIVQK